MMGLEEQPLKLAGISSNMNEDSSQLNEQHSVLQQQNTAQHDDIESSICANEVSAGDEAKQECMSHERNDASTEQDDKQREDVTCHNMGDSADHQKVEEETGTYPAMKDRGREKDQQRNTKVTGEALEDCNNQYVKQSKGNVCPVAMEDNASNAVENSSLPEMDRQSESVTTDTMENSALPEAGYSSGYVVGDGMGDCAVRKQLQEYRAVIDNLHKIVSQLVNYPCDFPDEAHGAVSPRRCIASELAEAADDLELTSSSCGMNISILFNESAAGFAARRRQSLGDHIPPCREYSYSPEAKGSGSISFSCPPTPKALASPSTLKLASSMNIETKVRRIVLKNMGLIRELERMKSEKSELESQLDKSWEDYKKAEADKKNLKTSQKVIQQHALDTECKVIELEKSMDKLKSEFSKERSQLLRCIEDLRSKITSMETSHSEMFKQLKKAPSQSDSNNIFEFHQDLCCQIETLKYEKARYESMLLEAQAQSMKRTATQAELKRQLENNIEQLAQLESLLKQSEERCAHLLQINSQLWTRLNPSCDSDAELDNPELLQQLQEPPTPPDVDPEHCSRSVEPVDGLGCSLEWSSYELTITSGRNRECHEQSIVDPSNAVLDVSVLVDTVNISQTSECELVNINDCGRDIDQELLPGSSISDELVNVGISRDDFTISQCNSNDIPIEGTVADKDVFSELEDNLLENVYSVKDNAGSSRKRQLPQVENLDSESTRARKRRQTSPRIMEDITNLVHRSERNENHSSENEPHHENELLEALILERDELVDRIKKMNDTNQALVKQIREATELGLDNISLESAIERLCCVGRDLTAKVECLAREKELLVQEKLQLGRDCSNRQEEITSIQAAVGEMKQSLHQFKDQSYRFNTEIFQLKELQKGKIQDQALKIDDLNEKLKIERTLKLSYYNEIKTMAHMYKKMVKRDSEHAQNVDRSARRIFKLANRLNSFRQALKQERMKSLMLSKQVKELVQKVEGEKRLNTSYTQRIEDLLVNLENVKKIHAEKLADNLHHVRNLEEDNKQMVLDISELKETISRSDRSSITVQKQLQMVTDERNSSLQQLQEQLKQAKRDSDQLQQQQLQELQMKLAETQDAHSQQLLLLQAQVQQMELQKEQLEIKQLQQQEQLQQAKLQQEHLQQAKLQHKQLLQAQLQLEQQLRKTISQQEQLQQAKLQQEQLNHEQLLQAKLQLEQQLQQEQLQKAKLQQEQLQEAKLHQEQLQQAKLQEEQKVQALSSQLQNCLEEKDYHIAELEKDGENVKSKLCTLTQLLEMKNEAAEALRKTLQEKEEEVELLLKKVEDKDKKLSAANTHVAHYRRDLHALKLHCSGSQGSSSAANSGRRSKQQHASTRTAEATARVSTQQRQSPQCCSAAAAVVTSLSSQVGAIARTPPCPITALPPLCVAHTASRTASTSYAARPPFTTGLVLTTTPPRPSQLGITSSIVKRNIHVSAGGSTGAAAAQRRDACPGSLLSLLAAQKSSML